MPDLPDLGSRIAAALGAERFDAVRVGGAAMDLTGSGAVRGRADPARRARARAPAERRRAVPGDLSRREVEVLRLVAEGLTTREIADRLYISPKTADHHIQHIYTKIGVSNRASATLWAFQHDVVD